MHLLLLKLDISLSTVCLPSGLGDPNYGTSSSICALSFASSSPVSNVTIENGVGYYNATEGIGSVARYECNEGFALYGTPARTCLYNGSWSGSIPECGVPTTVVTAGSREVD